MERPFTRRKLIGATVATALSLPAVATAWPWRPYRPPLPTATWRKLPRWRGFNLPDKNNADYYPAEEPYDEWDFDFVAEHGFNFVRLPLDYRLWTPSMGGASTALREIDRAVKLGRDRRIHVNLALFGAPGRAQVGASEPPGIDLWEDGPGGEEARRRFAEQWGMLAERYRGIPSSELSFNLLNEPSGGRFFARDRSGQRAVYVRAASSAVAAIRAADAERLIIADATAPWLALDGGNSEGFSDPVPELYPLEIAQSFHCYLPTLLTHYRVPPVEGSDTWPPPTWPYTNSSPVAEPRWVLAGPWDRGRIHGMLRAWLDVQAAGIGVHCGEFGCANKTPHEVTLSWMADVLGIFRELGVGWALWNLRGEFGVVDSDRADVRYENYRSRLLDRRMLRLLQSG